MLSIRVQLAIPPSAIFNITNTGIRLNALQFHPKATEPIRPKKTILQIPLPRNANPGSKQLPP